MIHFKQLFFLTMLVGFLSSCNQKPTDPPADDDLVVNSKPDSLFHPLTLDTFNVWKARWNADFRAYMAKDSLHYFDMPLADLGAILDETTVDNARFYMGMDSDTIPHLMLIGTNKGVPNYKVIADYSKACPPKC